MNYKSQIFILSLTIFILHHSSIFAETKSIFNKLSSRNYNVILVTICTLRADHLGCYGYFRNTSPNIDKLAKEGILFESAFSQASYSLPSLMSIHTSLYPNSHGIFDMLKDRLSRKVKTLAETLKLSRYKTTYFLSIEDPHTAPNIGLGRGFEYIQDIYPAYIGRRFLIGKEIIKIFKWIKKIRNQAFFLSYHNLNVHLPYLPSLKYKKIFTVKNKGDTADSFNKKIINLIKQDLKNLQSPIYKLIKEEINSHPEIFKGEFNQQKFNKLQNLISSFSIERKENFWDIYGVDGLFWSKIDKDNPFDIQYLKDLYDACILEVDQKVIGPLIDKLKRLNLYDKTMIIITSDHGDQFLEHGGLKHGKMLYDELIHIPLIIKLPKDIPYKQSRIKELVQSIDIMPTILDIFGIPIPKQAQGISLKGLWEAKADAPRNEYVYAKINPCESIRSEKYKLIYYLQDNQHELYDLNKDPQEKNNIYNQGPEIAKKLEDDFYKWRKNLPSYVDEERDFPPEIDEATRERIKSTGYW